MNSLIWPYLVAALGIIGAAVAFAHYRNRHLFSMMRKAEAEARSRCVVRPRIEISDIIDQANTRPEDRESAEQVLVGIAGVMGVPPETLRPEDRLGDLCRVELHERPEHGESGAPTPLTAFSEELLDFFERSLTDEEWNQFLTAIGADTSSESAILESILRQRLAQVVGLVATARSGSAKHPPHRKRGQSRRM